MELVAIRIKVLLRTPKDPSEGRMLYPNFNGLAAHVRDDQDWAVYIAQFGSMHLDKVAGFGVTDVQSPDPNVQWATLLVPEPFAKAALGAFPNEITQLSEVEFNTFYDDRAHINEADQKTDNVVLDGLRSKYGIAPKDKIVAEAHWDQPDKDAVDPTHPAAGLVNNPTKTYDRFKDKLGFTVKPKPGPGPGPGP